MFDVMASNEAFWNRESSWRDKADKPGDDEEQDDEDDAKDGEER